MKTIIVEPHGDGFRAHKASDRKTWSAGKTVQGAIGALVTAHAGSLGLAVRITEKPAPKLPEGKTVVKNFADLS